MLPAPTITTGRLTRAIVVAAVLASPFESVTTSDTLKSPGSAYVWLGRDSVLVPPSPNCHANVMASPSGSDDALPSKLTLPDSLSYGPPTTATGGLLGGGGGETGGGGGGVIGDW